MSPEEQAPTYEVQNVLRNQCMVMPERDEVIGADDEINTKIRAGLLDTHDLDGKEWPHG